MIGAWEEGRRVKPAVLFLRIDVPWEFVSCQDGVHLKLARSLPEAGLKNA